MATTKKPWITLSSKDVYENAWIKVEEHQVTNPSGNAGIYGKVLFKNKAIGVVPLDSEGNIYLVGQHRYPLDKYSWEIPEGGCPLGEDSLACAKRELLEETGLVAESWHLLGQIHTSNSVTNEDGYMYVAQNLSQQAAQPEDCEDIVVRKLPFWEAVDMVMKSQITDSISMVAILMTEKWLSQKSNK